MRFHFLLEIVICGMLIFLTAGSASAKTCESASSTVAALDARSYKIYVQRIKNIQAKAKNARTVKAFDALLGDISKIRTDMEKSGIPHDDPNGSKLYSILDQYEANVKGVIAKSKGGTGTKEATTSAKQSGVTGSSMNPKVFNAYVKKVNAYRSKVQQVKKTAQAKEYLKELTALKGEMEEKGISPQDPDGKNLHATADGLIAYLNQRIGATQAAAQKAGTQKTASSPAAPAKLNYTQKRDLTDLQRYTSGIRKNMDIAVKAAERMDNGEVLSPEEMDMPLRQLKIASNSVGKVEKLIPRLPAGHPDVTPVVEDARNVVALYEATKNSLSGATEKAAEAMGAVAEEMSTDEKTLKAYASTYRYASTTGTLSNPGEARDYFTFWKAVPEVRRFNERVRAKYDSVYRLKEKRAVQFFRSSDQLAKDVDTFDKQMKDFVREEVTRNLPGEIAETEKTIDTKVAAKALGWFRAGGGIDTAVRGIRGRVANLEMVADKVDGLDTVRTDVEALEKRYRQAATDLRDAIIASVPLPKDVYAGSDKGEIEQETRSLWAKKCPGEPILTFRFCDKDWQHKKGVDGWWSAGTFHAEKYDRSTLDYYVIVGNKDGKTATQWICSKIKDNLANTSRIVLKNSKYAKQVMLKDKLGK